MPYPIDTKEKAIALRHQGYSIKEVASLLGIAQGTSSIWLRDILLSPKAQNRLKKRKIFGQYRSRLVQTQKREKEELMYMSNAASSLSKLQASEALFKLCCALLFWCEGNKETSLVRFTSSDPSLINIFLFTLRGGFKIDETKFRVLMHLHQYHDEEKQKEFWSRLTKIPYGQFYRTYQKPNTGKRIHNNYPGCIAISYYDSRVAKELMAIYNTFIQRGVR